MDAIALKLESNIMPMMMLSVDIVCFRQRSREMQIALIRRAHPPFLNYWALPGGLVEVEEDIETAARRELKEETQLEPFFIDQFYCYGNPHRDPRGRNVSIAHLGLIDSQQEGQAGDDAGDMSWVATHELPLLAFDHLQIIEKAKHTLKQWHQLGIIKGWL